MSLNERRSRALDQVYRRYRQQLFTGALAITGCPGLAEDAIHDAFCRLHRLERLPGKLKAYVFRAVRNAALNQLRDNVRTIQDTGTDIFADGATPGELASEKEFRQQVASALRKLSDDERETVVQRLYGELTFREIAAVRQVPLGTAATWYRRGLERLKSLLQEPS